MEKTFEEKLIDKIQTQNIIAADLYKDYLIVGDNKGIISSYEISKKEPIKSYIIFK